MTGRLDKDGFCTDCGEFADYCTCDEATGQAAEVAEVAVPRIADPDDDPGGPGPGIPEPVTELGYARRLVAAYGTRLRYVPAWRRWLVWDGTRWAHDSTGQAARWMKSIARTQTARAMAITDERDRAAAIRLTRRGETSAAVAGALTLASTEPGIVVTPDGLDADPFLLNCANGTLDLRTGELRPHDPADLLTKITRAAYRPGADGPEFAGFLARVQPEAAVRAYLCRLIGHSLEGRVAEHIVAIFCGGGANGKTTFAGAMAYALGDYSGPADPELLTARDYAAHPTGAADLFGLRLAILHETDRGRHLAEATVKRLTGGDRIKARRMREDFWSFDPSHTFVMLTNHRPIVGGTDEGIWRRIKLIPWEVEIPPAEQDPDLGDRLALEADAILTWAVGGHRDWREHGLADPEKVTAATGAYRAESDAVARFVDQRCLTGPHFAVQSAQLFAVWSKWCAEEGEEHGTQTAFSLALIGRGFDKSKDGYGRIQWKGIALAGDDDA
jgi:putative DNA primase/helicase